jgi:hypothetical protein
METKQHRRIHVCLSRDGRTEFAIERVDEARCQSPGREKSSVTARDDYKNALHKLRVARHILQHGFVERQISDWGRGPRKDHEEIEVR